jgi:hypothetical protein
VGSFRGGSGFRGGRGGGSTSSRSSSRRVGRSGSSRRVYSSSFGRRSFRRRSFGGGFSSFVAAARSEANYGEQGGNFQQIFHLSGKFENVESEKRPSYRQTVEVTHRRKYFFTGLPGGSQSIKNE